PQRTRAIPYTRARQKRYQGLNAGPFPPVHGSADRASYPRLAERRRGYLPETPVASPPPGRFALARPCQPPVDPPEAGPPAAWTARTIASTTCSTDRPVVSSSVASGAGRSGLSARSSSIASRRRISAESSSTLG